MTRKLRIGTKRRLKRVRTMIERLPVNERPLWRKRLAARMKQPAVINVVGDTAVPESQSEWDLQFANWLDRVYGIVSDRATEVRKDAFAATSDLGISLMPLAVVAVAFTFFILASKKQGAAS